MYLFDDNKNKIEIVKIKTSKKDVSGSTTVSWTFSESDLLEYGIDDIWNWIVLSVSSWNEHYDTKRTATIIGTLAVDSVSFPNAEIKKNSSNSTLTINDQNYAYASSGIYCEALLIRVGDNPYAS